MIRKIILLMFCVFLSSVSWAGEWKEVRSDHFIVYYKNAPVRFVDSTVARAEANYQKTTVSLGVTRYKGWTWKERVKIYIYDDEDDYQKSSGLSWSSGSVITRFKIITAYPLAHGFFDSILPHEIGHIIFRELIGADTVVPLWLEEGVAMYQEESGRFGADDDVRQIMAEGKFISVPNLSRLPLNARTDPESVRIFYAEAASLVSFLINEEEMYRFTRLCREIKSGNRFEWALKKAYIKYQTVEALEKTWKGYLSNEKKERY